jgi:hypothetical protein
MGFVASVGRSVTTGTSGHTLWITDPSLLTSLKRDAQRVVAELRVKPARDAGGRKVAQTLDGWLVIQVPSWAPLTVRDQTSRWAFIQRDPIASMSVASLGVSDIDRWVARLRKSGAGEASIRNQHTTDRPGGLDGRCSPATQRLCSPVGSFGSRSG